MEFVQSFSPLQLVTKKIAAIKNSKITGWQKPMSSYILCKFWGGFQKEFLRNYSAYRAQIFRDNWNCYAL